MAGKLNTVKNTLLVSILKEVTLSEIFDSRPFKTSFNIRPGFEADYETESFKDLQGNAVDIFFLESGEDTYEVDFQVNVNSFKASGVEYSLGDYTSLLATVAAAVTQFLSNYEPYGVVFRGADDFASVSKNPNKKGQKDRIYDYFITQLGDNEKYKLGRYPDGIGLQRI
jgi:hypothetical protein